MEKRKLSLWVPIAVIAAALLMLAVSTGTVDAAPKAGRGGGKGHGGTTSSAVLTVSPNPVPLNSQSIVVNGSGFAAGKSVYVTLPGTFSGVWATTGTGSSFSVNYPFNFWAAGTHRIEAYVDGVLTAYTTFEVQ